MKEQTIIHVEYNGEHRYFGCIREVFGWFSPKQIGMSYSTFSKRKRIGNGMVYISKDEKFKMRKGIVEKRHPKNKPNKN